MLKPFKLHFCAFFVVVVTAVLVAPAANAAIKLTSPEAALLSVMNQTRQAHGLAALRIDPNLLRAGYRRVGIGAAVGKYSGVARARMVTADFAGR